MKFKFPVYFGPETDGTSGGGSESSGGTDGASESNPFVGSSAPTDGVRVGQPELPPDQLPRKETVPQERRQPTQATPPPQMTLSPEQIAELAANAALRVGGRQEASREQAPPQPRPVSDQEFQQHFGVVNLDAQGYANILGFVPEKPEHIKALNDYGQNLVRQALRMSQFVFQQELGKLRGEFSGQFQPLLETHKQTVERQLFDEFTSMNPDLKDHGALVQEIVTNLRLSNHQFQGEGAQKKLNAFNFVADRARTLLGKGAPQGSTTPQQQPTSAQPAQRRMTPMSMGGTQTSGGSASKQPLNDAVAIFG